MKNKRSMGELPTASMADIGFLLLTFYLLTTVINEYKGLTLMLPPWQLEMKPARVNDRNLFEIHINASNQFLVEGEVRKSPDGIRYLLRDFILNPASDPSKSESPLKAVVSLKTDRGTSYGVYLSALDEIQACYYELYADRAGLTASEFRKLNPHDPVQKRIYDHARAGLPMNISLAEPTAVDPR